MGPSASGLFKAAFEKGCLRLRSETAVCCPGLGLLVQMNHCVRVTQGDCVSREEACWGALSGPGRWRGAKDSDDLSLPLASHPVCLLLCVCVCVEL